jgi:hypothetical protein
MGLMDRDYWKNKGKPEDQTNKVSPRTKRAMDSLQESFDKGVTKDPNLIDRIPKRRDDESTSPYYNPKEFRGSKTLAKRFRLKWIYWLLLIATVVSVIAVERGITIEAIKTKLSVFYQQSDGSIINATKSLFASKDIIPGIIATAQTDFKTNLGIVDIEIDPIKAVLNYDRYNIAHNFHYEKNGMGGAIGMKILSVDRVKNSINARVGMHMWGAKSQFASSLGKLDQQICAGDLIRGDKADDRLECKGNLAFAISSQIKMDFGSILRLRLDFRNPEKIVGHYSTDGKNFSELGGFNLYAPVQPKKSITHSLGAGGVVSDCAELLPVEFVTVAVKNNSSFGSTFVHDKEKSFECNARVINRVIDKKVAQGVK